MLTGDPFKMLVTSSVMERFRRALLRIPSRRTPGGVSVVDGGFWRENLTLLEEVDGGVLEKGKAVGEGEALRVSI